MFTDVDYQVDVLSDEYRLLNPVISKMEKRLEEKTGDHEDEVWQLGLCLFTNPRGMEGWVDLGG